MTSVATKVGSSETSTPSDLLKALIESGSILAGVSKPKSEDSSKTFTDVIKTRLFDFDHESRTLFGPGTLPAELESNDTETLKLTTAYKSLEVIERIQSLLQEYDVDLPANNKESATPQGMPVATYKIISYCRSYSGYWDARPRCTKNFGVHRFWLGSFTSARGVVFCSKRGL